MKVKVYVDRAAAILAGNERYGGVVVDVDPATLSHEQREALAQAPERDGITDLTGFQMTNPPPKPVMVEPDPVAWLDWRIACAKETEARRRSQEKKMEEELEEYMREIDGLAPEAFVRLCYGVWELRMPSFSDGRYVSGEVATRAQEALAGTMQQARQVAAERNRVTKAEREAREEARKKAEEERATARQAQLDTWVREHGTESQKKRHARGMLSESEIVDGIRKEAFAPLNGLARYKKLTRSALEAAIPCEDDYWEAEYRSFDETGPVSEEVFAALEQVEDALPDGFTATLRQHAAYWSTQDWPELRRWSVMVKAKVGELDLSREYALPGVSDWVAEEGK